MERPLRRTFAAYAGRADRADGIQDFFGLDSSMQSRFGTVLKLEPWTAARAAPALVRELAQKFDIDAKPLEKHLQSALTPLWRAFVERAFVGDAECVARHVEVERAPAGPARK